MLLERSGAWPACGVERSYIERILLTSCHVEVAVGPTTDNHRSSSIERRVQIVSPVSILPANSRETLPVDPFFGKISHLQLLALWDHDPDHELHKTRLQVA